ncbi:MAG: ferritin-like domain-containing protein [Dehalococcoidia bacterium]|jgi:bacterioferritin
MENKVRLLETLNESLKLEYSMIIHYPLINSAIRDPEIKKMVNTLGVVSIKHADTLADAITGLGGTPQWDFEPAPQEMDLKKIFMVQMEKEKMALKLHTESANMVADASLKVKLELIARQEKEHIKLVASILALLDQGKS